MQGVPLSIDELNEFGQSLIFKASIDMENPGHVQDIKKAMKTFLEDKSLAHKEVKIHKKCFSILFDSKESRKTALDFITSNKPFDELMFIRNANF